jgi:hypothetical protein
MKQARRRAKKQCPRIKRLEREFKQLSALDVVDMLIDEFQLGKAEIEFQTGRRITIVQLHGILHDSTVSISPQQISPIQFFGGPPSDFARKYTGSILTLLIDRILYLNAINGAYADLVTHDQRN